ncbi:hypothetical protein D3C87_1633850 [compost metagenome]
MNKITNYNEAPYPTPAKLIPDLLVIRRTVAAKIIDILQYGRFVLISMIFMLDQQGDNAFRPT